VERTVGLDLGDRTSRHPDYKARAALPGLLSYLKLALAIHHKVKLVLVSMSVNALCLPWIQAVETKEHALTLEQWT
jgi:hypothetical protein